MISYTFRAGALAIALVAGISTALAHGGATGIVKERMDIMKSIGSSLKSIVAMSRGEVALDKDALGKAASEIAVHADHIPNLFPKDSLDKPSEATPAIWQDWAKFEALAIDLKTGATELQEASGTVETGSDIARFIPKIGKTCKGCHETFRIKK